jgi:sarcosine oxidase delta subunit
MSRKLPPCDHDECPPTHCKQSGSLDASAGSLLPCPFCGGQGSPFIGDGGSEWIRCSECAATSQKAWRRETYNRDEWNEVIAERHKQACAFWNRRANVPDQATARRKL